MSLLRTRMAIVAAAAAVAVAAPFVLLRTGTPPQAAMVLADPAPSIEPRPAGSLSFALKAPPFDPDRKADVVATPIDPLAALASIGTATDPAFAAAPPLPQLVGIAAGGRGRGVALMKDAAGETVIVGPGERVNGWRLVSVSGDRAVFQQGGRRKTARLEFPSKANSSESILGTAPAPTAALPSTTPEAAASAPQPQVRN